MAAADGAAHRQSRRSRREDSSDNGSSSRNENDGGRNSRASSTGRPKERLKSADRKRKNDKSSCSSSKKAKKMKDRDGRDKKDSKKAKKSKKKKKMRKRDHEDRHRNRKRERSRENDSDSAASGISDSDSDSDDQRHSNATAAMERPPTPDLTRAAAVVRELLTEFPSISRDLLVLLQMLDDGEAALLGGLANPRIRDLLASLFPLLGVSKLREPAYAFVLDKRHQDGGTSLLETVASMVDNSTTVASSPEPLSAQKAKSDEFVPDDAAIEPRRRHSAPIGPQMPPSPTGEHVQAPLQDDEEEEGDAGNVVGPALPGERGFRLADENVEAEMARQHKEMQDAAWRRARGERDEKPATAMTTNERRQEWMTQAPTTNKLFKDIMGPSAPASGRPAAFRTKEPAAIDHTWFDSPQERERAQRAKLDMELLGYVREGNAAPKGAASRAPIAGAPASLVNESILPAANPEADENMRKQMDALRDRRGPSLLEQHQKKVAAEQAKRKDGDAPARPKWDRERDLAVKKSLSRDDADRIINASKQVSSKFTAPTVTRQFL